MRMRHSTSMPEIKYLNKIFTERELNLNELKQSRKMKLAWESESSNTRQGESFLSWIKTTAEKSMWLY